MEAFKENQYHKIYYVNWIISCLNELCYLLVARASNNYLGLTIAILKFTVQVLRTCLRGIEPEVLAVITVYFKQVTARAFSW